MKGEQGSDDDEEEEEEDEEEDMNDEDDDEEEEDEEEEEEDYEEIDDEEDEDEETDEDEDEEFREYRAYGSLKEESRKEQGSEHATSDHSHVRNLVLSPQYRVDSRDDDVDNGSIDCLNRDDSEDEEPHRKSGAGTSKLRNSQRNLALPQPKDSHSAR